MIVQEFGEAQGYRERKRRRHLSLPFMGRDDRAAIRMKPDWALAEF
jgi:hypothetical protein